MPHGVYRGSDVLRRLEDAHRQLRDGAAEIDARLKKLESEGQENLRRRGDTLVDLARLYLPDLERGTVESSFQQIRSSLREVLVAKQQRQRELQQQWDATLDARQKAERRLDEVTERLDGLVARRGELEAELAERLRGDAGFQQRSAEALAAEQRLERNEERVEEIRQEAAEKLPAYDRSRLFKYLVDRGFGTPGYKKRGLTKRLDKWVGRLVDFDRSKKSYDFLRVTPGLMEAEVDRRRADFESLMEQIDAIEERASREIGLTEVLSEGVAAGGERNAAVERLEKVEDEQQAIGDEVRLLEANQGEFHRDAVERMKRFLGSMRESALEAHARATADPEDDRLMDEIRWLNDRLDEAREESEELHPRLRLARTRQRDLGEVLSRFRRLEYDSHRSVFSWEEGSRAGGSPEAGLDQLVKAFIAGERSAEEVWSALERRQRFEPTWAEQEWGDREWGPPRGRRGGEFSYVLMHVLAEAAGAAIRHAEREARRRSRRRSWQSPPSVRRRARGGFTGGDGF